MLKVENSLICLVVTQIPTVSKMEGQIILPLKTLIIITIIMMMLIIIIIIIILMMQNSKIPFCCSKLPETHERISLKIDNLGTHSQKGLPALV
jgi:hypothetical protein